MTSIKKIRSGDTVKIMVGAHKGKVGKVLSIDSKHQTATIEGIGTVKRHVKPNQVNPRGGTKDVHVPFAISKVALVVDQKTTKTSRVGLIVRADGGKSRVARALGNKEIK